MTCRKWACRCRWMAAVLLILGGLLGSAHPAQAKKGPAPPRRFLFNIDPKTPLAELLPPAPDVTALMPPWLVRDLVEVPEILFAKPEAPIKPLTLPTPTTAEEKRKEFEARMDAKDKAMEKTAYIIAKINHLNRDGRDRFLQVLRERRRDLDGLPFVMGDACRQNKEQALAFVHAVAFVREAASSNESLHRDQFWASYASLEKQQSTVLQRAPGIRSAALMQMLAPESAATRQGLVAHLAGLKDADATRALTRMALFSFDLETRKLALLALKTRDRTQYAELLLAALRYPWPAVAQNASEAVVQLGRKDLVSQLVALLDEPDPRAPAVRETGGKQVLVVREMVRLNHQRNCLLCHPPGNTPDVIADGFPRGEVVTGAVPSPGVDLPPPSAGYRSGSPDILVRADVTYLRQDFSRMQPVKDAAPWPVMQRFDFLVRTRTVTEKDAAAYQAWLKEQGPNYLPPHRQAALMGLRALTGRNAAPTAKAWRAILAD